MIFGPIIQWHPGFPAELETQNIVKNQLLLLRIKPGFAETPCKDFPNCCRQHHHQGYWKQVFYLDGGPSWKLASETQARRSVRQTSDQADNNITWPYKMSADVEGLITLGGLHMIHERNNVKTCGPIMAQGGVQAMETMLYTIDHINQQEWWLKDVPLGKTDFQLLLNSEHPNP